MNGGQAKVKGLERTLKGHDATIPVERVINGSTFMKEGGVALELEKGEIDTLQKKLVI